MFKVMEMLMRVMDSVGMQSANRYLGCPSTHSRSNPKFFRTIDLSWKLWVLCLSLVGIGHSDFKDSKKAFGLVCLPKIWRHAMCKVSESTWPAP